MYNVLAASGVALALLVPTAHAAAADAPPAGKITVEVATVNGSGCPQGSSAVAAASDNTSFTVTYSAFTAQAGGDSKATDARKNCQLNLKLKIPQGYTYAISSVDYRGFAHLEDGASALQRGNYYFTGNSANAAVDHRLSGPADDNWQTTDRADINALVFKPCGEERNFNINSELRVDAGGSASTSFVTMDSVDQSIRTKYNFAWKKCP
ncbi:DUF4360 domain-containing protein [Pseudonocardiaceae bacterium YIM PH 21723]|nr:DUF4360 domain-containing protein [Pseudonocardiaceae bacterium YIM PH 21723]